MIYKFYCETCDMEHELDIPMDKYTDLKDKQKCPHCKNKLNRIIEWEGPCDMNGGGYEGIGGRAKWQH